MSVSTPKKRQDHSHSWMDLAGQDLEATSKFRQFRELTQMEKREQPKVTAPRSSSHMPNRMTQSESGGGITGRHWGTDATLHLRDDTGSLSHQDLRSHEKLSPDSRGGCGRGLIF